MSRSTTRLSHAVPHRPRAFAQAPSVSETRAKFYAQLMRLLAQMAVR